MVEEHSRSQRAVQEAEEAVTEKKYQYLETEQMLHEVEVDGVNQEVETRVSAWAKSHALRQTLMNPVQAEDLLGIEDEPFAGQIVVLPDIELDRSS